jgi:hypothetical protein
VVRSACRLHCIHQCIRRTAVAQADDVNPLMHCMLLGHTSVPHCMLPSWWPEDDPQSCRAPAPYNFSCCDLRATLSALPTLEGGTTAGPKQKRPNAASCPRSSVSASCSSPWSCSPLCSRLSPLRHQRSAFPSLRRPPTLMDYELVRNSLLNRSIERACEGGMGLRFIVLFLC